MMQVVCDYEHLTECGADCVPTTCPICGSRRLTYIAGDLKDGKSSAFGKRGGVTQVTFKRTGRMDELDQKYGNRY